MVFLKKSKYTLLFIFIILFKTSISQELKTLSFKLDSTDKYTTNQIIEFAKNLEKKSKEESSKKHLLKAYSTLAKNYYIIKKYNKSIRYFDKEIEILEKTSNNQKLSELYYNLGSTCLKLSKNKKAKIHFEKSLQKAIQINNEGLIRANNNALVITHENLSNYQEASFYLKALLNSNEGFFNNKINLYKKEVIIQKRLYKETKKNLDTTKTNLQKSIKTVNYLEEDTLKKRRKISSLNFQKALKDWEIEQQNKALLAEKKITFLLIIGISSISILAILIFFLLLSKKKMNQALVLQKEKISKQNKSITNSIQYASKIQRAVLPNEKIFETNFKGHFIFFKPRDIVSGDFYFIQKVNRHIVFAAADCTGHGVPGGFLSMLGIAFLNDIIRKKEVVKASQILDLLRDEVKNSLQQKGEKGEQKDGMDIAICAIDTDTNKLQYAGAYNPLILIRSKEIIEYKADKMPIGIHRKESPFTNHTIQLEKGDKIYIYSDGFQDQIGGNKKKKYKSKAFKQLLLHNSNLKMREQKSELEKECLQWRSNHKQIDDIVIIGVKI